MVPGENDLTLVAPNTHVALAGTLVAEGQGPSSMTTTASIVRTTVLPRVDSSAGAPSIVTDTRERYASGKLLGEGGVGEVVRATDNDIARPVAIKRIRNEVKSPAMLLRFVEEIRTIGQLEHPNIVPIHDVGIDEKGDYFFVMKYVEGETIEDIITRLAAGDPAYHAKYTVAHRVQIFMGILEAIAHAHSRGFVHRDLKPANVMVGEHGQVMVMDWGLAKRVGTPDSPLTLEAHAGDTARLHQTAVGSLLGTPAYMAPEQARGEEATAKSDIYALCVLFYEFLTLTHYLEDCTTIEAMLEGVQHRNAPMAGAVASPHQRSTPMDLSWFLKAGLAKDPQKRFASVDAMIERLELRAQGIVPIQCHITLTKRLGGTAMRVLDRYPLQVSVAMLLGLVSSIGGLSLLVARAFG
ncbi:MAG TPA: serine/threonine-protein kinase [Polyangiaceae bacterium]